MRAPVSATLLLLLAALGHGISARTHAPEPSQPQVFAGVLDEHPAIQYAKVATHDPVAHLRTALAGGASRLEYRERGGYLDAILKALHLSPDSQLLVFSKTGVQRASTGPTTPRALYFNDSVVVGYIPGARFLEIAAQDPQQGVVFYTIDQAAPRSSAAAAATMPVRETRCLTCHVSGSTLEVPGMIARSIVATRTGEILPQLGSYLVDHRTPLAERWGGYFVTGSYEAPPYAGIAHMGNVTTAMHPASGPSAWSNEVLIEWLNSEVASRDYPSRESDIAALMIFDHQMRAMNLLTRLNWETRVAGAGGGADFTAGPLRDLVDEVADYFVFTDEAPPPGRVTARPGFVRSFLAPGPRDRQGRSLRELDLDRRLFRYPCSYMIYTAAFEGLPTAARRAVYLRLRAILTSEGGTTPRYGHLSRADRQAILDILRDTKKDLPDGF